MASPTTWSTCKAITGNQRLRGLLSWFFIVPIAAKALSAIESPLRVAIGARELELNLELPFSWQVFFLSTLFIILGNVVFHWRCPGIVREFEDFADFQRSGRPPTHIPRFASEFGLDVRMKAHAAVSPVGAKLDDMRDMFWEVRDAANGSRPRQRRACMALLSLGIAGFLFVAIQNVAFVLARVF
jgi:hypothetical protein